MLWLLLTVLGATAAPDPVDAFLATLAQKREAIHQVTGSFYQKTIMPDDVATASGSIAYLRPRQLAVRFTDPELDYLIGDKRVVEYDAELGQVQIGSLSDAPEVEVLFAGFGQDTARLREAYDLTLFKPEDGPKDAKGLELRPKKSEDELFKQARLYLRDQDMLPYRIEVVTGDDNRVIYDFDNLKTDEPLSANVLKIHVPEGTRIIQNDELIETVGTDGKDITLSSGIAPVVSPPTTPSTTEGTE